jgi:hypothetical protein
MEQQSISIGHIVITAFGVLYTIALAFGAQVWLDLRRRTEKNEHEKAERSEVDELRTELRMLADDSRKASNSTHQINVAIARLTEQIARVVSDIESEKRTRAESSKALLEEIRRSEATILQRLTQVATYGRRQGDMPS